MVLNTDMAESLRTSELLTLTGLYWRESESTMAQMLCRGNLIFMSLSKVQSKVSYFCSKLWGYDGRGVTVTDGTATSETRSLS